MVDDMLLAATQHKIMSSEFDFQHRQIVSENEIPFLLMFDSISNI